MTSWGPLGLTTSTTEFDYEYDFLETSRFDYEYDFLETFRFIYECDLTTSKSCHVLAVGVLDIIIFFKRDSDN